MTIEPIENLNGIAQAIFDKKGMNILVLDVRDTCSMTDFFVIAEGTVDRHVRALSHVVVDFLDKQRISPLHLEGEREGDWVVIDYGDIVVHLFTPELREKYSLESLWREAKIVDVKLMIHPNES